jgi:Cytochrome C oxidase, cbb3-type, subunit III
MLTGFRPRITVFMVVMTLALTARTAAAQSGKQDYEAYCTECHGSGGKGNGPSVQVIPMNPPPPDLTQLAKKNGGKFPFDEVVDTIDGRKNIPSHERIQMPFLGATLQKRGQEFTPESNAEVKRRIESMARYVETLQQK